LPDTGEIFLAAQKHLEAGQLAEAEILFEKVLKLQPDHLSACQNLVNVRNQLGDQHLLNGRPEIALICYQQASLLDKQNPGIYNNQGRALLALGQIGEGIERFKSALAIDPVNTNFRFNLALGLSGLGDFAQSIGHFRKTLRDRPDWPEAIFGLATALSRTGNHDEAVIFFRQGLHLQPEHPDIQTELASCLIAIDKQVEALSILTNILKAHPRNPQAHFLSAGLSFRAGRNEDAVMHNRVSLENGGDIPGNSVNMANALTALRKPGEAIKVLREAIKNIPANGEVWLALGNVFSKDDQPTLAIDAFRKSIKVDPTNALAANNLSMALLQNGDPDKALKLALENSNTFADDAVTWGCLGAVLLSLEQFDQALATLDKSLNLEPDVVSVLQNKGKTQHRLGQYKHSLQTYRRIAALSPDNSRSHFNLGNILQTLFRHGEAIEAYRQVLEIDDTDTSAWSLLAHSLNQECRWEELEEVRAKVIEQTRKEIDSDTNITTSPFSLLQLSAPGDVRLASARQSARAAEKLSLKRRTQSPLILSPKEGDKLRIGYISPDFRNHSAGRAFLELMRHHDKNKNVFHGYSTSLIQDNVTTELAANFHTFTQLGNKPFADSAQIIHDDDIDILVDLAGHTKGSRLEILAERPAPVQVHYLGYGHTIGADYVDWLLTDEIRTPASEVAHCHENVVYLPNTTLPVYVPSPASGSNNEILRPSKLSEGLPENGFVFANFNGHYKFDQEIFSAWMKILRETPNAILWLMHAEGGSVANLSKAAENSGVDPSRLVFAQKCSNQQHLARLALADIALDTFHHAGGVTTTDALWAGVPVLTLLQDDMIDRMGASLLTAAHLPELIATSVDNYVERALTLQKNRGSLDELKTRLISSYKTAPLFDTPRLAKDIEVAYEAIWHAHTNGNKPKILRPDIKG